MTESQASGKDGLLAVRNGFFASKYSFFFLQDILLLSFSVACKDKKTPAREEEEEEEHFIAVY